MTRQQRKTIMHPLRILPLLLLSAVACGDDAGGFVEEPVKISFEARVAGEPFKCGQDYTGLGADAATGTPQDFRFYVHDVRLVTEAGAEHPVDIEDDGDYQGGGVALLDFEDGTGACTNGTELDPHHDLRHRPRRAAPRRPGEPLQRACASASACPRTKPRRPHGAAVPAQRHDDVVVVERRAHLLRGLGRVRRRRPFDLGVHVGSTGCEGDAVAGEVVSCSNSQPPRDRARRLRPRGSTIVVDWGALLGPAPARRPVRRLRGEGRRDQLRLPLVRPRAPVHPLFTPLGLDWSRRRRPSDQSVFRVQ
jgi:hypothetical protein